MAKKKKNSASQFVVWVILGLLIVGLAGFGATNFGGTVTTVASVGDRDITVDRYANALNQEINRLSQQFGTQLSFEQAQMFGIDRAVLSRILSTAALENEADALGISAGDEEVRDALLEVTAFQGVDGNFNREGYRFALDRAGLTEAEFEGSLRSDLARNILTEAVSGAATMPDIYIDTILTYSAETRDLTWAVLTADDLADPIPAPTEEDLTTYWEENSDAFMLPETRDITYAWITPEMIAGTIEGDDAVLRTLYDGRSAEYNRPERRLVERLIFTTEAEAQAALAAIEAGEKTYEELVAERDLTLEDVDLGDVAQADLGDAGAVVFALEGPGLAGPAETDLGFALFRMNGILAAQVTPFEDAREELLVEFRTDAARRAIADMIDEIDDLLAGGATLEELGTDTQMEAGEIQWAEGASGGIAAYPEFRQGALDTSVGDFPEVLQAEDGSLFALRVNEVIAPRVEPFEDARDRVELDWRRQQTVEALAARARVLAEELRNAETEAPAPPEDDQPVEETANDTPAEETPVVTEDTAEAPPADTPVVAEDPADTTETPDTTEITETPAEETPDVANADEAPVEEDTAESPAPVDFVTELGLGRDGFIPDTPSGFVDTIFTMEMGEIRVIEGVTAAYIVRLDAITPPDLEDPEIVAQADAIRDRMARTVGDDILSAYAAAIQADAGITLNQAALNAVHSQLTR